MNERLPTLVPLSELAPGICNLTEVLPDYAPVDQIGLNLRHLGRLARWGGMYPDVTIRGQSGEISSVTPSVVGHDGFGTAFMGAGKVDTIPLSEGVPEGKSTQWRMRSALTIQVNTSELENRVKRVRDPADWSQHINRALIDGVRDGAWRQLLASRLPKGEIKAATFAAINTAGIMGTYLALGVGNKTPDAFATAIECASFIGALNLARMLGTLVSGRKISDTYLSLMPLWPVDRMLAVQALSYTRRLARPL